MSVMKARPIIFGPDMIRALLDGRKTQTRRVVRFPLICRETGIIIDRLYPSDAKNPAVLELCPYGQPGDLLWVRETWYWNHCGCCPIHYRATEPDYDQMEWRGERWKSPVTMPRWASRITLRLTDVRVERVQDISMEDQIAEGASWAPYFKEIWDGINAKRGHGWDTNPWVWVLVFHVKQKNVDEVLADV